MGGRPSRLGGAGKNVGYLGYINVFGYKTIGYLSFRFGRRTQITNMFITKYIYKPLEFPERGLGKRCKIRYTSAFLLLPFSVESEDPGDGFASFALLCRIV